MYDRECPLSGRLLCSPCWKHLETGPLPIGSAVPHPSSAFLPLLLCQDLCPTRVPQFHHEAYSGGMPVLLQRHPLVPLTKSKGLTSSLPCGSPTSSSTSFHSIHGETPAKPPTPPAPPPFRDGSPSAATKSLPRVCARTTNVFSRSRVVGAVADVSFELVVDDGGAG